MQQDLAKFEEREAQVLSCNVDSVFAHQAFAEKMGGISYPMLADFHPKGAVAGKYGVMWEERGISRRAIFIIDKNGVVRFSKVYEGNLPESSELLAELDRLRTN